MHVSCRTLSGVDIIVMSWPTYVFNESTLVLEGVTLAEEVELVVEVLVDLSGGTVLDEETAEDTETAHPEDLAIGIRISKRSQLSLHIRQCSLQIHCDGGVVIAYLGIRASAVPFLLPKPRCRPSRRAAFRSRARARECIVTGLRMMRPSWTSLRMV
jgi:hypothetical protein